MTSYKGLLRLVAVAFLVGLMLPATQTNAGTNNIRRYRNTGLRIEFGYADGWLSEAPYLAERIHGVWKSYVVVAGLSASTAVSQQGCEQSTGLDRVRQSARSSVALESNVATASGAQAWRRRNATARFQEPLHRDSPGRGDEVGISAPKGLRTGHQPWMTVPVSHNTVDVSTSDGNCLPRRLALIAVSYAKFRNVDDRSAL